VRLGGFLSATRFIENQAVGRQLSARSSSARRLETTARMQEVEQRKEEPSLLGCPVGRCNERMHEASGASSALRDRAALVEPSLLGCPVERCNERMREASGASSALRDRAALVEPSLLGCPVGRCNERMHEASGASSALRDRAALVEPSLLGWAASKSPTAATTSRWPDGSCARS
jgi:hypothetical protein